MRTYKNDALIGNKELKVGLTKNGEIVRICYPNVDYRQTIEHMHMGVKINDSNIIYLHKDVNNMYNQEYVEDTNILETIVKNTYFNLKMEQTDFVCITNNVIIRKYTFTNEHEIPLDIKFLVHSKVVTDENNYASAKILENGLLQYSHEYNMAIISNDLKVEGHRIHGVDEVIETGILQDKDYIGMSNNSAVSFEVGILNPGETKEFSIMIYLYDNKEKNKIEEIKKIDVKKELQNAKKHWKNYLKSHIVHDFEGESIYKEKINNIYKRTILLYPLLTNEKTGGISAAMEVDESFSKCGRYSYCWPRDAVYITKAQDLLKMTKETDKFYKIFCKNTQESNGMWEQRFYTDGTLAPCWGYQIDETASVIYGVYDHYTRTKDKKFLKDNLKMLEKAVKFLDQYMQDIKQENPKMQVSYDLWEMHEGISTYSLAVIYSAYDSMLKIYKELEGEGLDNKLKQENISKQKEILEQGLEDAKEYVKQNLYDEEKKSFIRSKTDRRLDMSALGLVIPFEMFSPNEKKITNTIEMINLKLRTYTGGYLRFEDDHYTERRPWVITTLWMGLYYAKINDTIHAKECFDFAVNSSTKHGFLAEQVDNENMEGAWVIGLAWSHAMFVILLEELIKIGAI